MMRYIMSYGAALVIILIIGVWLASGTLIQGGKGPGNGEREIISIIEPDDNGPVRKIFTALGLAPKEEPSPTSDTVATNGQNGASSTKDTTLAGEETGSAEKLQTVRYENFSAQIMPIEVNVRGQTQANAVVSVRAETSGLVKQVLVNKGQVVAPGDLLCSIDKGARQARLAQATATLAQAQSAKAQAQADFDTNFSLREKQLVPANTARQFEVSLRAANASVRSAIASLDEIETDLANTDIRAEIDGIIQDPLANVGDMLGSGGICATIVQFDPMLFVGQVSETKINLIKAGLPASVTTITGKNILGTVRYIAASAERATRSFEIEIELENSDGQLRDGVTATATIIVGNIPAQLIPQSALTLETDGTLGVRILLDDIVSFRPIQIVGDATTGVWVRGLPQEMKLITLGQEYVKDGQRVLATLDTRENLAAQKIIETGSAS